MTLDPYLYVFSWTTIGPHKNRISQYSWRSVPCLTHRIGFICLAQQTTYAYIGRIHSVIMSWSWMFWTMAPPMWALWMIFNSSLYCSAMCSFFVRLYVPSFVRSHTHTYMRVHIQTRIQPRRSHHSKIIFHWSLLHSIFGSNFSAQNNEKYIRFSILNHRKWLFKTLAPETERNKNATTEKKIFEFFLLNVHS